jgi:hypothetical protein
LYLHRAADIFQLLQDRRLAATAKNENKPRVPGPGEIDPFNLVLSYFRIDHGCETEETRSSSPRSTCWKALLRLVELNIRRLNHKIASPSGLAS